MPDASTQNNNSSSNSLASPNIVYRKATSDEIKTINERMSLPENTSVKNAWVRDYGNGRVEITDIDTETKGLVNGYVVTTGGGTYKASGTIIKSQSTSQSQQNLQAQATQNLQAQQPKEEQVQAIQGVFKTSSGQIISGIFTPEQIAQKELQSVSIQAVNLQSGMYTANQFEPSKIQILQSSINTYSRDTQIINKYNAGQPLTPSEGVRLAILSAQEGAKNPQTNKTGPLELHLPLSSGQKYEKIAKESGLNAAYETYYSEHPTVLMQTMGEMPFFGGILRSGAQDWEVARSVAQEMIGQTLNTNYKGITENQIKVSGADVGFAAAHFAIGTAKAYYTGDFIGRIIKSGLSAGLTAIGGPALASRIGIQSLSLSSAGVALAEPVIVGVGITGAQAGLSAGMNVLSGQEYNKDFKYIFSPENVGKNIVFAPALSSIGLNVYGVTGLPSSTFGAVGRGAVIGATSSLLFSEPETRQIKTENGQIITYQETPILRNIAVGAVAGGLTAGGLYEAQSRGWDVNIGFQKGLEKTDNGVVQNVKGFTALVEKVDTTGQAPTKFYGIAVMREGAGVYVGNKEFVYRWSPITSQTGGMASEFGKMWYDYKTPEMMNIQKEYFASKGINVEELKLDYSNKLGQETSNKLFKALEEHKGYIGGSSAEKQIIRGSGILQSEYNPRLGAKPDIDIVFIEKSPADIEAFAKSAGITNLQMKGGSPLAIQNAIDTSYKFSGQLNGAAVDITVLKASPVPPVATGFASDWLTSFSSQKGAPVLSSKTLISMKSSTVAYTPSTREYQTYEEGKEKYLIDFYSYSKQTPESTIKTSSMPVFKTASIEMISTSPAVSVSNIGSTSNILSSTSSPSSPASSSSSKMSISVSSSIKSSVSSLSSSLSSSVSKSSSSSPSSISSSFSSSVGLSSSSPSSSSSSSPSSPSSSLSNSSSSISEIITTPPPFLGFGLPRSTGEFVKIGTQKKVLKTKEKWSDLLTGLQKNIRKNIKI